MLIEAIYTVKTSTLHASPTLPIASLSLKPLSHPIYDDEHILSSGPEIAIFLNSIISFTTHPSASKVFTVIGNSFLSFESIFPCTAVHCSNQHLIFLFSTNLNTTQILNKLAAGITEETNSLCKYIINGADGSVTATLSQLKRGIYLNKNTQFSVEAGADLLKVAGGERLLTPISEDISRLSVSSDTLLEPEIYSNKTEYTNLIKAFLNENGFTLQQNAIKHCIIENIETFYFIFFNFGGKLTVLLVRKLYNYIHLYNHLQRCGDSGMACNDVVPKDWLYNDVVPKDRLYKLCLSIPDLNTSGNSGNLDITILLQSGLKSKISLPKFTLSSYNAINQIILILKYSSIVLKETKESFWFIMWLKQTIYPFSFPGLVICPVISTTAYLLDGPFPLLVASSLNDKKNQLYPTPRPGVLGRCKGRINSILNNKAAYIRKVVLTKRTIDTLPCTFTFPFLIEQYFLNEPKRHIVDYSVEIPAGEILFRRGAYLNISDAVSLWLMLYKGKVNFQSLIRKRWVNLEYLCRRACIEKNISVIRDIIKISSRSTHWKRGRPKPKMWKMRGRRVFSGLERTNETDILRVIGNHCIVNTVIDLRYSLTRGDDIKIEKGDRFSTRIEYKGREYRLMRICDILQSLDAGYENDQLVGSILAYLKYSNLPIEASDDIKLEGKDNLVYECRLTSGILYC